jgi:hypothetical protein
MQKVKIGAVMLALLAPLAAVPAAWGDAMRCSNAYHPFGPTVQREYQLISEDVGNFSYRESFLDFSGDSFTRQIDDLEGGSLQVRINCAADGTLSIAPAGVTFDGEAIPMMSEALLELYLPPAAEWQPGKRWTYQIERGPGLPIGLGTATLSNEIIGPETVTVPAGTFDALRVETLVDQQMTLDLPGAGRQVIDLSHRATSWYAKGIGMVRSVSDEEEGPMTVELVDYRQ